MLAPFVPEERTSFAQLFKKYRLRSEIETLSEFGDLLAEEGFIYETSLFTKWQNGSRVPRDRNTLLAMLRVFAKKKGIQSVQEANYFFESANQGALTSKEIESFSSLMISQINHSVQISLGSVIREYKVQKGMSDIEITLGMGWEDPSILHNLENGTIEKPNAAIIDKLCSVLKLASCEKNRLLYSGGYIPQQNEIDSIRRVVSKTIESWPYPCVLIDFSWRVILENQAAKKLFNHDKFLEEEIYIKTPCIIDMQFDQRRSVMGKLSAKELTEYKYMLTQMLVQFRLINDRWKNEEWYRNLLSRMKDNQLFREIWAESSSEENQKMVKSSKKVFIHPRDPSKRIHLDLIVSPLIDDPRFEIEYLYPANSEAFKFFNNNSC